MNAPLNRQSFEDARILDAAPSPLTMELKMVC